MREVGDAGRQSVDHGDVGGAIGPVVDDGEGVGETGAGHDGVGEVGLGEREVGALDGEGCAALVVGGVRIGLVGAEVAGVVGDGGAAGATVDGDVDRQRGAGSVGQGVDLPPAGAA